MNRAVQLDAVIFGGGAAGLWLLDALRRTNVNAVLLEAFDLGSGQTIASQGIIHGGLKYTLSGLFTPSAKSIRDMPLIWRRCLAGEAEPNLSTCRLRAEFCYLWRTSSLSSKLAMIGARTGLHTKPQVIDQSERPAALADVPGTVARLDEQVIEPGSFLEVLAARNRDRLFKIDAASGLEIERQGDNVNEIRLINPESGEPASLAARTVIFLAGQGNAKLRELAGLPVESMQRRPLHMVMARGNPDVLSELNGHCVDGASTRVTITSTIDFSDRRIWQIGGQLAEEGTRMSREELVERAKLEVRAAIPGIDLRSVAWSTYAVDRAEAATGGVRPEDVSVLREGNVITGWPTKLALVPRLVERVLQEINETSSNGNERNGAPASEVPRDWPRPAVALPPWESETEWFEDH